MRRVYKVTQLSAQVRTKQSKAKRGKAETPKEMEAMMYPGSYVLKTEPDSAMIVASQPVKMHAYPPVLTSNPTPQFAHTSPPLMMCPPPSVLMPKPATELIHTSQPVQMFPYASVMRTQPTAEASSADKCLNAIELEGAVSGSEDLSSFFLPQKAN
ncbi:peptidase m14 carboxypeptidase a [Echinococcus multilocularis]|uniref:Peptidase m14 carboxypeptidase a n=1 Tax=Echinococcus multilocularis TaxID=6211 RepID=U6I0C3_ECHMU|nr:peptidase m14 carboxypeptidase a [Echinococcus multilocularis]CDS43111.1 peptidase m14 carboxypeptidase a [Echinococcus multilocularis]